MDHKDSIIARLQQTFDKPPLSGAVDGGGEVAAAVAVADCQQEVAAPVVPKGLEKVYPRYAHLDPVLREQITSLLLLEQNYPLRGYLSADGLRAGIVMKDTVREYHWQEFLRYSRLFFGHAHDALCTIFKKELQAVAARYGKNRPIKEEEAV